MGSLENKRCIPCEGGVTPIDKATAQDMLKDIPDWELETDGTIISREFSFKGFLSTMNFVNAVAWIAQQQMHHPDMKVGYNYCHISFSTHAIDGLSENDFICAAKINQLLEQDP